MVWRHGAGLVTIISGQLCYGEGWSLWTSRLYNHWPYGILYHMVAKLLFRDKFVYADGAIREMVIWRLPESDEERPHGLKYSLFYGIPGKSIVRYDNERGKGDHRHYGDVEEPYTFSTVEQMILDFATDIERYRGEEK